MDSLLAQDYPRGRLDIVVVDNGSDDPAVEAELEQIEVRLHNRLRLVDEGLPQYYCTSTGHVHDAVVLYRGTIHIQL